MNSIQNFFAGIVEGIAVPLIEIIVAILITMVLTVQEATKAISTSGNLGDSINIPLFLGLFAIITIIESLAIGLGDTAYAIGYCIGAIVSLYLFATVLLTMYPAATSATIGIVVLVVLGIILKFAVVMKSSQNNFSPLY